MKCYVHVFHSQIRNKSCTTWPLQLVINQQHPLTEQMASEVGLLYFCILMLQIEAIIYCLNIETNRLWD